MADDVTETETPVIVGDVDTAPDEVTNEGDTVVIVETPDDAPGDSDAVDAVVVATEIDLAQRVAVLEAELAAVRETAASAEFIADIALDTADAALVQDQEILSAVDEAIVETVEGAEIEDVDGDGDDEITSDEVAPASSRVHPWFRSMSDWRAGK